MDISTIQHRFANRDFGKFGSLKGNSCSIEGRNFYSYHTIFAQWLDLKKQVVIYYDGSTSSSSSKHQLWKGLFPSDVHAFPYNDKNGSYYSWQGCKLVSWLSKDEDFKVEHRMKMINEWVIRMYNKFLMIKEGKGKGREYVDFEPWSWVEELCGLYKDTTINKYLKSNTIKFNIDKTLLKQKKTMVRLLMDGERNVEVITDSMFGEGTYAEYMKYSERFRKADRQRAQTEALCKRIGIDSPYGRTWRSSSLSHGMSAKDIRNLSAKERLDWHWAWCLNRESKKTEEDMEERKEKSMKNAFRWIVGFEPKMTWGGKFDDCVNVRNMFTNEIYGVGGAFVYGYYLCQTDIEFKYKSFAESADKEQWIRNFYDKCREVQDIRKAILTLERIKAHYKEVEAGWRTEKVFIADDYLRNNTTDDEYEVCVKFIDALEQHVNDVVAQARAREIARIREEEERKREEEFKAKVKQEQIQECVERGADGMRDLWRKHLASVCDAERTANSNGVDDDFFYFGGNVLLRLSLDGTRIETSKNVKFPVEVAKKMWRIVQKWHENPETFKPMEFDTKGSGKYTIKSYNNDILTAGCHNISYTEMCNIMAQVG